MIYDTIGLEGKPMDILAYRKIYESLHIPRYKELPDIELYSDQVISYLNKQLASVLQSNECALTTAMINNYVKQGLIIPTNKKKYSKDHLAYLLLVCIFKQVYTIGEILEMIKIQEKNFSVQVAYDYFCTELENAIKGTFNNQIDVLDTTSTNKEERLLVRSTVLAYAHILYVRKYIEMCPKFSETSSKNK